MPGQYRGLLPHQPLIYSSRGMAGPKTQSGGCWRQESDATTSPATASRPTTRLYKRAGIRGGSSHSGRSIFAGNVLATTGDMETVAQLLGHSSIDCSQRYVDLDHPVLKAMFMDTL